MIRLKCVYEDVDDSDGTRFLLEKNAEGWEPILEALEGGNVTLLYSARDVEHNSALVLKSFLEDQTSK
jgi:uncharacterized protein YeaO (DUF488 family)